MEWIEMLIDVVGGRDSHFFRFTGHVLVEVNSIWK
jgi:hypothetical protein